MGGLVFVPSSKTLHERKNTKKGKMVCFQLLVACMQRFTIASFSVRVNNR